MKTVRRLLAFITEKYKLPFIFVFFCILMSTIAGVIGNMFIQRLVDDYITPLLLTDNPVFTGLLHALLLMAFIYIIGVCATLLYNRIMVVISQGVMKNIRDDLFSHMQTLPIKYFDTHTFGDVMSCYTNDTDTLREMLSQSIPQAISSTSMIISVVFAMLIINAYLSAMVFVWVVIMLIVIRKLGGKSTSYFVKQQATLGKLDGYIEEMINGQKVIKVFCHEREVEEEFDRRNDELRGQSTMANTFANIVFPIMANLGNLQYVLIAILGGIMAIKGIGAVTLGAIASFLTLSKSISNPIAMISQQVNSITMALAGAERIFDLLDEKSEEDGGFVTLVNAKYEDDDLVECHEHTGIFAWRIQLKENVPITYVKLEGDVQFYNVDFGYTENKRVLHDVSIYANKGEKIALVGATGAGKTTITNLINRFYDIADGKIRFDDININTIKKSDLRHALGVVLQDTNLFTGTIYDNIRYGKLDATDDEVIRAAKLANAHDFIMHLPNEYNTVISGDGSSISQGQKQLISIARAAVYDPPVMILDEATSSIDTRTEEIIQKGMDSLMHGRTVFVIAHRLSTVQNADAIMVMEDGRIIERGNHESLLEKKGKYYQLYTGSFEE